MYQNDSKYCNKFAKKLLTNTIYCDIIKLHPKIKEVLL